MAGRKQHYIPQFLLRAFATPASRANYQVNVYHRTRGFYCTSTVGVAAKRDFYSDPPSGKSQRTLDDEITTIESTLASFHREWRGYADKKTVCSANAALFVAHLAVRQAHIRDTFGIAVARIFETVANAFSSEQKARAHMGFDKGVPTAVSESAIAETLAPYRAQIEAAGYNFDIVKWLGFKDIQAKFPEIYKQFAPEVMGGIDLWRRSIPAQIRSAHNKALSQGLHSTKRVNDLEQLNWHVQETGFDLILPDCVAVAGDKIGCLLPAMFADEAASMLMPISARQLLVGTDKEGFFKIGDNINEELIGCSLDFFIAKTHYLTYLSALPQVGRTVEEFLKKNQPNL